MFWRNLADTEIVIVTGKRVVPYSQTMLGAPVIHNLGFYNLDQLTHSSQIVACGRISIHGHLTADRDHIHLQFGEEIVIRFRISKVQPNQDAFDRSFHLARESKAFA